MSKEHIPLLMGLVCLVWLVAHTLYIFSLEDRHMLQVESSYERDQLLHSIQAYEAQNIWISLARQDVRIQETQFELDKLRGKVDVIDAAVLGKDKTRARILKAISIIKDTLPPGGNTLPGCPKAPSPGELWSIAGAIIKSADEYAVSAALITAVIRQESAFCNVALSHAGAKGYMQLMPETAAQVSTDVVVKTRRTLRTWIGKDNIQMGTAYLSQMILEFDGNIELAAKAYNAGPIHLRRVLAGERTLYSETKDYAEKVLAYKKEYEELGLQ